MGVRCLNNWIEEKGEAGFVINIDGGTMRGI
jgi:hypothetical protein